MTLVWQRADSHKPNSDPYFYFFWPATTRQYHKHGRDNNNTLRLRRCDMATSFWCVLTVSLVDEHDS